MATLTNATGSLLDSNQVGVSFPSLASGDLLILMAAADNVPIFNLSAAFTPMSIVTHTGFEMELAVWRRIADGTEPDLVALGQNTGAARSSAWIMIGINGHNAASVPGIASFVEATTANPDPPSVTAAWGSEENLFIAVAAWDGNVSLTSPPSGYTTWGTSSRVANVNGCGVAYGAKLATSASDDPGTFTISGSEQTLSTTVVVRLTA